MDSLWWTLCVIGMVLYAMWTTGRIGKEKMDDREKIE